MEGELSSSSSSLVSGLEMAEYVSIDGGEITMTSASTSLSSEMESRQDTASQSTKGKEAEAMLEDPLFAGFHDNDDYGYLPSGTSLVHLIASSFAGYQFQDSFSYGSGYQVRETAMSASAYSATDLYVPDEFSYSDVDTDRYPPLVRTQSRVVADSASGSIEAADGVSPDGDKSVTAPLPRAVQGRGYPVDWNETFQSLLELPENTMQQQLEKNVKLSALGNEFVSMASRWGKIIIEEAFIPLQYRTIVPVDIGGKAGGEKYIYNGILFKLQTDWKGYYNGDYYAAKTGGLELKGLMRYGSGSGMAGLSVPMMAIIDYRGFRLVAMSILPISATTLVYGSNDAGLTMHDDLAAVSGMMARAGKLINIKAHICGVLPATCRPLFGPTDIEVHLGSDGRFYVLDFARVFPPTGEPDVRNTFLYKLFRPEFLKSYPIPLSSDAFANFSRRDPDRKKHEREVIDATVPIYLCRHRSRVS